MLQFLSGPWRYSFFVLTAVTLLFVLIQGCASLQQNRLEGTWVVTDAVIPGDSAISTHEASKWFGQSYRYQNKSAMLDQISCREATYTSTTLAATQFFQQYNVPLTALTAGADTVDVVQVGCETGYPGPGQKVFMVDDGFAYIFWDGVFFKLEKTV